MPLCRAHFNSGQRAGIRRTYDDVLLAPVEVAETLTIELYNTGLTLQRLQRDGDALHCLEAILAAMEQAPPTSQASRMKPPVLQAVARSAERLGLVAKARDAAVEAASLASAAGFGDVLTEAIGVLDRVGEAGP